MLRSHPFLLLALLFTPFPASAQTSLAQFPGGNAASLSRCVGGHDLDGDGIPDLVLGAPFDNTVAADAGAVSIHSGATGALIWSRYGVSASDHYGSALAMSPDLDGDGFWEVVVGSPGFGAANEGALYLLSGRTGASLGTFLGTDAGGFLGTSVAADFDYDMDGTPDFAAGAPFTSSAKIWSGVNGALITTLVGGLFFGGSATGGVDLNGDGYLDLVMANLDTVWTVPVQHSFTFPGALGLILGHTGDVDGDGRNDLLVGDPGYDGMHVNGGGVWAAHLNGVFTTTLLAEGGAPGEALGNAVAGLGDLDGDGWEDWAFGATAGVSAPGHVRVVSGRFKQEFHRLDGSAATMFPTQVQNVGDLNGDGVPDLAVADPTAGSAGDGFVEVFSSYGPGFVNYCPAGKSASGCLPTLSGSGTPSAFPTGPFVLSATGVEGDVQGSFFYAWNGRQANPWGNGSSWQCVTPPVKRASMLPKSGTKNQCDGQFSQDLNAFWSANSNKNPGAGTIAQAQLWYRDPQSTSNQTTSLSDAIEFYVGF